MKSRIFINKLHFYLALIATVPVVILCITGSILVYKESIDGYFTEPYMKVEARGERLPIAELKTKLEKELPGKEFLGVVLPEKEGQSYYYWMKDAPFWTVAYIDPYTGNFKGVRAWEDWTWANLIWWVTDIHYSFKWGRPGSYIAGVSSAILFFSILSGLYLWWPRRSKFSRSQFTLRRGKRWKQTAWNLHGVIGFYTSLVLIVITLTGITITFYEPFNQLMHALTRSGELRKPPTRAAEPGTPFVSEEVILANGIKALKDQFGISPAVQSLTFPTPENVIAEIGMQGKSEYAGVEHTHVFVNGQSGEVVEIETQANRNTAEVIVTWMSPLHYGTWGEIFGESGDIYTRIVWLIVSLTPIFLMVSGYSMVKKSRWKGLFRRK